MSLSGSAAAYCEQILRQAEGHPLILLPCAGRRHHLLAAQLIGTASDSHLYGLGPQDRDLHPFLRGLAASLEDNQPGGGALLRQALLPRHARPEALATALTSALARLNLRYLVLDDLDPLAASDEVQIFFQQLVRQLPPGLHIVIKARQLHYRFWAPFIQSGQAVVLADGPDSTFFIAHAIEAPHLEVYALSGGAVYVDGRPVAAWDGPLPRHLFYYLVDHPIATRDEIFETFWPGLPGKEATNVFHVTKRKISTSLGFDLTTYSGGFYHHTAAIALYYDVEGFERATMAADAAPEQAWLAWQQAVRCYCLPFLYGIETPWVKKRRHQAQAEADLAISFYLRAQREFPEREDLCRELMALYHTRGETTRATEQYRRLGDRLRTKFGIKPSKTTDQLYQQIAHNRQ